MGGEKEREMSYEKYRFRGKPLEALTREELLEALVQALDRLADQDAPFLYVPHEQLMGFQRKKNAVASAMLNGLAQSPELAEENARMRYISPTSPDKL